MNTFHELMSILFVFSEKNHHEEQENIKEN